MPGAISGVIPAHGELVARESQPDDAVARAADQDRSDHLMGEEQPVLPGVVALVREAREELANQAVLARVDLHTVDISIDERSGSLGRTRR